MTDEASFLAAIAAAPADETLPLVFADWLDEQGDPRGQWIRNGAVRPWMGPTFENPIPAILEALAKDRRVIDVRRAAEAIGEPIVFGLVELLKHDAPRVRQQACICLRKIGRPAKAAVPALLKLLSDPDYYVREKAAKALEDIGASENTDTDKLKAALTDQNWSVRRVASKVLGSMKAKGSVLEELVERFDSPDVSDRTDVVEGLAQLGTVDVVPHLDRALDDAESAVRVTASAALGRLKHAAVVPPLCRALKSRDSTVRETAAEQFAHGYCAAPLTAEAVTALIAALPDRVARVRVIVCCALTRAGSLARGAVPALLKRLDDDDEQVRAYAVEALGTIAHDDATVLPTVLELLVDEASGVAGRAAEALAKWSVLPPSVVPGLMAYLRRARTANNWQMSPASAFAALAKVPSPPTAVLDTLRTAIRDWNNPECWPALIALCVLGPAAAPAIPELLHLLDADSVHQEVVSALIHIGEPGLTELSAIIDGPTNRMQNHIVQRLAWIGGDKALPLLPALRRLLHRVPDDWNRGNVIRAISGLGPRATDAIPDLLELFESGTWEQHASDTFQAISKFGTALAPYIPRLEKLALKKRMEPWRGSFATLFANLAPDVPGVLEPLQKLLRIVTEGKSETWGMDWGNREVRLRAIRGFAILNAAAAIPDAARLVADPILEVRRAAVTFLEHIGNPAAVPPLRVALTDTEESVRVSAAEALGTQNDTSKETLAALVHAVEDRAPKVRRAAVDALGKLKIGTEAVLAALEVATEDHDKKVTERAALALKKVTPKSQEEKKAKPKKEKTPKDTPPKAKPKKKPT